MGWNIVIVVVILESVWIVMVRDKREKCYCNVMCVEMCGEFYLYCDVKDV